MKELMNKLSSLLKTIVLIVYCVIAIIITTLILSYNDYKISVIGNNTLFNATYTSEGLFNKGDLVIIKNKKIENVKAGDKVYIYTVDSSNNYQIEAIEVVEVATNGYLTRILSTDNQAIDARYLIGDVESATTVPNIGMIISIAESRFGYLFLIVTITLLLFLYELIQLILEIKYGDETTAPATVTVKENVK